MSQKEADSVRHQVTEYAVVAGVMKAARKYKKPASTIRGWIKKRGSDGAVVKKKAGHPLLLGEFEEAIKDYVTDLRNIGGVVTPALVSSIAEAMVKRRDRTRLEKYGGEISKLTWHWGRRFLLRNGFVKRSATKAVKQELTEAEFLSLKNKFHARIGAVVEEERIPLSMVVNMDETPVPLLPCSRFTWAKRGSRQVKVVGKGSKVQFTGTLACTGLGRILVPQLIYAGTTSRCHPRVRFPEGFLVDHSPSHWQNRETMVRYLEGVIGPYFEHVRNKMGKPDQKGVLLLDAYRVHFCTEVMEVAQRLDIILIEIPANSTDKLQPLDLTVNRVFKNLLGRKYTTWFASEVDFKLRQGLEKEEVKVDTTSKRLKSAHVQWITQAWRELRRDHEETIKNGFKSAGLIDGTIVYLDTQDYGDPWEGITLDSSSDSDTDMEDDEQGYDSKVEDDEQGYDSKVESISGEGDLENSGFENECENECYEVGMRRSMRMGNEDGDEEFDLDKDEVGE